MTPDGLDRSIGLTIVRATVPDMTTRESLSRAHLAEYGEWMRSWGATEATIATRTNSIAAGVVHWGDPRSVSRSALEAWLASQHFAAWTRYGYHFSVRAYFGWLVDTGRRDDDPTLGMRQPRAPRH